MKCPNAELGTFFMQRLTNAFRNSVAAFGHLFRHETAFKQECLVLLVAIPVAAVIANDLAAFVLLLSVILLIMLVEVLNTAVEATCDALTPEFDANIKIAKDCGSLAVLIACCIASAVWMLALANWITG